MGRPAQFPFTPAELEAQRPVVCEPNPLRSSVFSGAIDPAQLDTSPFKVRHSLMSHEALELNSLAETLMRLPENQVNILSRRLNTGDPFEETVRKESGHRILESTLHNLMDTNSLIMVNSPEVDSAFRPIYEEIMESISELVAFRDPKRRILMPTLYLFIASPNSVTPFHLDRYSTFLFQFRGSKEVHVGSPWDTEVVSDQDCEAYVSYANTRLPWSDNRQQRMQRFHFKPGEALHIPFVSGHYVKNGPDDISISMSIIFNTQQTMMWRKALNFNHRARKILSPVNLSPAPIGQNALRDASKARLWQAWLKARKLTNR